MERSSPSDPRTILGSSLSGAPVRIFLTGLASAILSEKALDPEIKSYSDAIYVNYYLLGVSFMLVSKDGSKALKGFDAYSERLMVDSIDIYNPRSSGTADKSSNSVASTTSRDFMPYPRSSIDIARISSKDGETAAPTIFRITKLSTGKDFVSALGEPDRKGGGAGPANGSIGIWCEWKRDGIMVRSLKV